MNRLQSELSRLYLVRPQAQDDAGPAPALIGPADTVRAMVMELARPPSWEQLSSVWRGVQSELELPAPAIAVSGTDGLQLWFSLAEPVPAARAHAFMERLRQRFLADTEPRRVRLMPAADGSAAQPLGHAGLVPALQQPTGNWSAFVAPDLAPVFDETPWLDIEPSEEGQANLLRGLGVVSPAAFEEAMAQLEAGAQPQPVSGHAETRFDAASAQPSTHAQRQTPRRPAATDGTADPRQFLLQVMQDEAVPLALRMDAAKALLPYCSPRND